MPLGLNEVGGRSTVSLKSNSQSHMERDGARQRLRHLAELEKRLADLQARLPAHSLPPAMIAELEELEDQIAQLKTELDGGTDHAGI